MELKGTQNIRASRAEVWAALNDPAVLQQCIPGCESFSRESDSTYAVVVMAAVGPVRAKFSGRLVLSDIRAGEGYVLTFEGSGGVAGFAKGGAQVALQTEEGGTALGYEVNARVGGKLAQVGARLIDGVAAKMADEFFSRFKGVVENAGERAVAGPTQPAQPDSTAAVPATAAPADQALPQPGGSATPIVLAGAVDLRLSWPPHMAPPPTVVLPVLSVPSVLLMVAVAVASYLLGRLA